MCTFFLRITKMSVANQSVLPAFFSPQQVNLKINHRILPNTTIPEDDLLRLAWSQKMTYREWKNPGRLLTEISQISAYNKLESQKKMWLNQQPKAIIRGRAIPACRKPESIGIFKLTPGDWKTPESHFDWTKSSQKSLSHSKWLVSCSSRETVSLKFKQTCWASRVLLYSGSTEPSLAPQIKWPDNTYKAYKLFILSKPRHPVHC